MTTSLTIHPERRHTVQSACISGANGFIGSHLRRRLESAGIDVFPIPRDYLPRPEFLANYFLETKPSLIFHLAAYGNHSTQTDQQKIFDANVVGTFNMLQASKEIPYKAFVNISSSSVDLPTTTMYAASKVAGEALVRAFVQETNKPVYSLRPFSVYGPGEASFRFIPTVIRSICLDEPMKLAPTPVHDWVYIDDFISYLMYSVEWANNMRGEAWEVGSGSEYTNQVVVEMLEKIAGKKANIELVKEPMRSYDATEWHAHSGLPSRPLLEGLTLTYDYYKPRFEAQNNRN